MTNLSSRLIIIVRCVVVSATVWLCSSVFAQTAQNTSPTQHSNTPQKQLTPPTHTNQAEPDDLGPSSKVKRDNWQCTLHAAGFDIFSLQLVITTLSTYHLQHCSPSRLNKLYTASAVAQLRTVASFDVIVKGGAHQQVMDINLTPVSNEYYWVSDLKFSVISTIRIGIGQLYTMTKLTSPRNLTGKSYVPFKAQGEAHYIWNTGTLVHRLVSPEGDTYIMTGYTREVQPDLTRSNLSQLDTMLRLPAGWTFENYFLDKTVVVRSGADNNNTLVVLFDDLNNNYVQYE